MPKIKGGKLKAKEVKDFLQASYEESPPNELDGYILDKSLSNATAKVYYNPQTNHAVVAHRGTKGALDWGNNLAYALGAYEYTSRYKQGKSVQDKAEKKYGKSNISTLGHSQGSVLARKLGTDTKEVINVNPAYSGERPAKNEYNIRSSTDVVSGLYAPVAKTREYLFPKYSGKHDIIIPSKSATDVLGEHSYRILDRLGEKEIGVGAGNKISHYNIMKGGRTQRLGYSFDDIDFTRNNCGAVGTAYINKGYNPIGVIGGDRGGGQTLQGMADVAVGLHGASQAPNFPERAFQARDQRELDGVYRAFNDWINESGYHYDHPATTFVNTGMRNAIDRNNLTRPDDALLMRDRNWLANDAINRIGRQMTTKPFKAPDVGRFQRGGALSDSDSESSSDEEMVEVKGGKIKNPFKKVGKAFDKVGSTLAKGAEYANPMMWALKNKDTSNLMGQSGELTHDYLLPAVVSAGKPIYDATAMAASTMLTGNPVLGKVAADTMWNEMVAKPGNDPRQYQKSKELGELSGTFGQAAAKPFAAALGGSFHDGHSSVDKYFKAPKGLRRGGRVKPKVALLKKGGASAQQIGLANAMRTFTAPDNTTYYALSDLSHSADNPENPGVKDFSAVFRNLNTKDPDPRASDFLNALFPSYLRQKFYIVEKMLKDGRLDPAVAIPILDDILRQDRNADRMIKGYNNNWGATDPVVRQIYTEVEAANPKAAAAKIRRERGYKKRG